MAKDMSKVFLNLNGYTVKSIRSIVPEDIGEQVLQSDDDIYGEFENLETPTKKMQFTLVVPAGDVDELTISGFMTAKLEMTGTFSDKRGSVVNTIAFNKARVQKKSKTIDRGTDAIEYVIIASRIIDGTINK